MHNVYLAERRPEENRPGEHSDGPTTRWKGKNNLPFQHFAKPWKGQGLWITPSLVHLSFSLSINLRATVRFPLHPRVCLYTDLFSFLIFFLFFNCRKRVINCSARLTCKALNSGRLHYSILWSPLATHQQPDSIQNSTHCFHVVELLQFLHTCLSCFISTLLLALFVQPQILGYSVFWG